MQVIKGAFNGLSGALTDLQHRNLWPTTFVVDEASEAGLHWHTEDVYAYIIDGASYAMDAVGGRFDVEAGDLLIIPAKTLHAEGEISSTFTTIVGIPEALKPDRLLFPRDPSELPQ